MRTALNSVVVPQNPIELVVIGASAGGIAVLRQIVAQLPAELPVPVAIVQHCHAHSPGLLPAILRHDSKLPIKQAENGERLLGGCIYVAPPGRHLVIDGPGFVRISDDEKVRFCRPSVDLLFSSAAKAYGQNVLPVVLSGANDDGAEGARLVDLFGGIVLAQSAAAFPRMPYAAAANGSVDHLLPVEKMAAAITALCMLPGAAAWMQRHSRCSQGWTIQRPLAGAA